MSSVYAFLVAIIVMVVAMNFFMVFRRFRRDFRPRSKRVAMDEITAAKLREKEVWRRIEREQEDAARQVELRNNTFKLYDIVRKRASDAEQTSDAERQ